MDSAAAWGLEASHLDASRRAIFASTAGWKVVLLVIRAVIFRGGRSTYQERSSLVESPERMQLEWHYNINNDGHMCVLYLSPNDQIQLIPEVFLRGISPNE